MEVDVAAQHVLKGEYLRLTVNDSQHYRAEGHLQLRVAEQLIQHDLRRSVALYVYLNMHALAVGVILDVRNTLQPLVLYKVSYIFNKPRLIHLVGQLGDDYLIPAVLRLDYLSLGADGYPASACRVRGAYAASAHYHAAGRKIRTGQIFHQLGKLRVGVIYQRAHRVDSLAQVVRRYLRSHTYRDTAGTVHQKVREAAGQHDRLFKSVVVVRHEINCVLVDIGEHIHRYLAHARLGISVRRGRVAVDRTEVSVTVDQHISHREVLRKAHHSVVNRCVAVRVIRAQHGTYGVGALVVRLARLKTSFIHGVQNTPVNRLQAVAHVGKRARHDNAHRVVKKALAHLVLQVNIYYPFFS